LTKVTDRNWQKAAAGFWGTLKHRNLHSVHFSSQSEEWYTPPAVIYRVLKVLGAVDLDPCSNPGVPVIPAARHFTKEQDGLNCEWHGRVYMNPPYGFAIKKWIRKLVQEYRAGRVTEAIVLIPARTDTGWFRRLRRYPICFVRGRLRFRGAKNSAPFPSAIVYLGEHKQEFREAFRDIGEVWVRWSSHKPVQLNKTSSEEGIDVAEIHEVN
jgi:hypothetical protein